MYPTVRKIDFFGGLHGHYLELVVNIFIDQVPFDLDRPVFNENGACHLKKTYPDYQPMTLADHWSYSNLPFDPEDYIIRIVPEKQDMLIGVTNGFLRAGDQCIDIKHLEKNTLQKMQKFPKLGQNRDQITKDLGTRIDYPRSAIRNYFYSMFNDDENGINQYRFFDSDTNRYHEFPFRAFFDFNQFLLELNRIAKFVNLEFQPTPDLWRLHSEFLVKNQGYHSEIKCQEILRSIFSARSMPLDLTLTEEAWINYQLGQIMDFYDDDFLGLDEYPRDTLDIAKRLFG